VPHQIASYLELLVHRSQLIRKIVANGLQLETDASETLRNRIVHLVGQPLSFIEHSA
jgi:hypothetical protein